MKMSSSQPTYCSAMKKGPWKAKHFDWQFSHLDIADCPVDERGGITREKLTFQKILKELHFQPVANIRNTSKETFLQKMHAFKRECTEEPCGCVCVAVFSHGVIVKKDEHVEEGGVAFYEDYILTHPDPNSKTTKFSKDFVEERVSLKEIVEIFRDKQLKGIPKIFFIQACRNKRNDKSADVVDRGVTYDVMKDTWNPFTPNPADRQMVYSAPHLEDTVIVFSTPFNRAAGFDTTLGSHVWQALGDTLKEQPEPVNLLRWLRKTNQKLQEKEYEIENARYMPLLSICHTLSKHVEFKKAN
ncbi:caspase-1-like isoform X1 [Crassostrea virginica]